MSFEPDSLGKEE